jgi:hypothetical protein
MTKLTQDLFWWESDKQVIFEENVWWTFHMREYIP